MIQVLLFGFDQEETDALMQRLIPALHLGHEIYSVVPLAATWLYDKNGTFFDNGKAIVIPGFKALLPNAEQVAVEISKVAADFKATVSMIEAPIAAAFSNLFSKPTRTTGGLRHELHCSFH